MNFLDFTQVREMMTMNTLLHIFSFGAVLSLLTLQYLDQDPQFSSLGQSVLDIRKSQQKIKCANIDKSTEYII